MATMFKNKSLKTDGWLIQFTEKRRTRSIFLGSKSYSRKTAERMKDIVETLIYYRKNGITIPDPATELWIKNAPEVLREKLARVSLITVTRSKTCKELWDSCLKSKMEVKPATIRQYCQSQSVFFATFSLEEPIDLITPEQLLEWKRSLLTEYATATVASHLNVTRMIFTWAVEQEWLSKNPMRNIPIGSYVNRENDRIISVEEYAKLLAACPNQEWRTIIALARMGGLRCPSELKRLRWSDINWEQNRFLVRSSKTERHAGKHERIVPLFSELRAELDRHFLSDETEGSEFVIQSWQGRSWKLGHPFQKIADNAGLGTIIRPFDNMRMSRSNEVARRWGTVKESLWIGHSERTMEKHYFSLTDDDFSDASGVAEPSRNSHVKSHAGQSSMEACVAGCY